MKISKIFLIYIASFISQFSLASSPSGLPSFQNLIDEFRGPLEAKLRELPQNYIVDLKQREATFFLNKATSCASRSFSAKSPLASVALLSELSEDKTQLQETGIIRGCIDDTELKEFVHIRGANLKRSSFKDYLNGKIKIEPLKYDYFKYQIKFTYSDSAFFTLESIKKKDSYFIILRIFGTKFLTMSVKRYSNKESDYVISYHSYSVQRPTYRIEVPIDSFHHIIKKRQNTTEYFVSGNGTIAPYEFASTFRNLVVDVALGSYSGIISYVINTFPITQQVSSGGQNSRLIDELKLAFVQLLNRDFERLKVFILQLIEAAKESQIIDQRPKN